MKLPEWWPDWMDEPERFPLGECKECHAQQYTGSTRESHMSQCSRWESLYAPGPFREVPWPRRWLGPVRLPKRWDGG